MDGSAIIGVFWSLYVLVLIVFAGEVVVDFDAMTDRVEEPGVVSD